MLGAMTAGVRKEKGRMVVRIQVFVLAFAAGPVAF